MTVGTHKLLKGPNALRTRRAVASRDIAAGAWTSLEVRKTMLLFSSSRLVHPDRPLFHWTLYLPVLIYIFGPAEATGARGYGRAVGGPFEFDEAKRQAEAWFAQLAGSAVRSIERGTVREVLEAYLAELRRQGRPDTALDVEGKFRSVVYQDAVADLELEVVTRDDFLEWRDRLLEAGRRARTVNRYVRSVVAAPNQATDLGYLGNPGDWRLKALSDGIDETGLDVRGRKIHAARGGPFGASD